MKIRKSKWRRIPFLFFHAIFFTMKKVFSLFEKFNGERKEKKKIPKIISTLYLYYNRWNQVKIESRKMQLGSFRISFQFIFLCILSFNLNDVIAVSVHYRPTRVSTFYSSYVFCWNFASKLLKNDYTKSYLHLVFLGKFFFLNFFEDLHFM